LDWKGNRKKQKKPLLDLLKVKDLGYPLQKRLVRRQRMKVIMEIAILLVAGAVCPGVCLLYGAASSYGAYDYGTYDWVYEWAYGGGAYTGGIVVMIVLMISLCMLLGFMLLDVMTLRKNRRLAEDIGALSDQIQAVREGNLADDLQLSTDTDLQEAAKNLNEIQKGMETALREQIKSERMKVDLVTNVSHDIKTPLTSIISYVELLRQEQNLPEHVKEFIQILGEKSERLRNIVQDVFEISKATSGQLPVQMEILDMGKLLRQTLADMNGQIIQSSFTMKLAIPETPMPVLADGQRLYRVFQNLLQNALYYSLEGSRIYLSLTEETGCIVVRMKNTSSVELEHTKDFTERFVRGDESRTDGGNGLGLSIAKSFTQACGGNLTVETDADLFTVTVSFQKAAELS
jgi:signal transduction histidine kinase